MAGYPDVVPVLPGAYEPPTLPLLITPLDGSDKVLSPVGKDALAVENDGFVLPVPTVEAGVPVGKVMLFDEEDPAAGIEIAATAVFGVASRPAEGVLVLGVNGAALVAVAEACLTLAITSSGNANPDVVGPALGSLATDAPVPGIA